MQVMHVKAIDTSLEQRRIWFWRLTRMVTVATILDDAGNPVESTEVQRHRSDTTSGQMSGFTDAPGQAHLKSGWRWGVDTFTLTDVIRADWLYDPALNFDQRQHLEHKCL